jgi:hypothetical protein
MLLEPTFVHFNHLLEQLTFAPGTLSSTVGQRRGAMVVASASRTEDPVSNPARVCIRFLCMHASETKKCPLCKIDFLCLFCGEMTVELHAPI